MNEWRTDDERPGGRLSGPEALELSAQIAGLARAGMPMAPSLSALAEELPRGRLKRSLRDLARDLEAGRALPEAVEGQEDRIPPHLRGLMLAGIRSGRLGEVLGEFAGFAAVGVELRRRLWLKLAYPVVTLILTLAVFAFAGVFVLPQLQSLLFEFQVPLPEVSPAIMRFIAATAPLWPGLAALALAFTAAGLAARWLLPPATTRAIASGIPLVGGVWRWTALAEFCHLLAILIDHRLPMPEALRLAGAGVQHNRLASVAQGMAEDVESGQDLGAAAARRRELPRGLGRLLRWGEDHDALPQVLHMAGELFAAQASARASLVATVVTVACFFMIFIGASLIVLGLVYSIFEFLRSPLWW
ncbi:MAG: type II secretion system F family protein [Isosphaeraceae bacterium]